MVLIKVYKLSDIETVADETYYNAMMMTKSFEDAVTKLPNIQAVSLQDGLCNYGQYHSGYAK